MSFEQKWNDAVQAKLAKGMTRRAAVIAVASEDKELHANFLAETNAAHGRPFAVASLKAGQ